MPPLTPPSWLTTTSYQVLITNAFGSVTSAVATLTVLTGNALPPPVLQAFTLDRTTLNLSWSASAGSSYQLQYNTDLGQTNWTNLGSPITAVAATDSMTNSQRFYRVMLLP